VAENENFGIGTSIGYILILGFAVYAALKFYKVEQTIAANTSNRRIAAPGVSYYCNRMVTHRPQQVQAFQSSNTCQTTQNGYAPAFGPAENMNGGGICGATLGLP
jgi:hypothetical protein